MKNKTKKFDELNYGQHFQRTDGSLFIKVKNMNSGWLGFSVWFQDDCGNRNQFNSINYNGTPANIPWDEQVSIIDQSWNALLEELKTFGESFSKNPFDNSAPCDKVEESKATTDVVDAELLKNKHIETTKQMNTYNNLTEAVVAAINELKSAGSLSAYQVTTLIRQKTNQDEWAVTGCEARQNQANIKFWINHDDVRRTINDLYANNELDALGFTGRQFNGTYMEYSFDVNATAPTPVPVAPNLGTVITTAAQNTLLTPSAPFVSPVQIANCVTALRDLGGDITLKRVQSALKVKGVTCQSLYNTLVAGGYSLTPGPSADDYYSQYVVE